MYSTVHMNVTSCHASRLRNRCAIVKSPSSSSFLKHKSNILEIYLSPAKADGSLVVVAVVVVGVFAVTSLRDQDCS